MMSALSERPRITPSPRRRTRAHLSIAAIAVLAVLAAMTTAAAPASAAVAKLTRYPYLTDLTTSSVQVTFDTDVKISSVSGAVRWGVPNGAGCTLTGSSAAISGINTINAPLTVAGIGEYQTSIRITGLTAGSQYCYRVFTGGSSSVDLLGADAAPRFTTLGSGNYTFDILGDWGDNSINGGAAQQKVDALIANSGAQFAVSTGDIAYQTGTQTNYGNLTATGSAVSEVFGPTYWKAPGATTPLFSTLGNHGRSLTFLQNWKEPATVAASNGKYQMETYSGLDGTTSASYPSGWYAFDVGNSRFYVLDADWNDSNSGTAPGGAYQVDRDYHWQTGSPEYQWLKADLASHPSALKFAFFHYPLRADSATEPGDTFLQSDPNNPASTSSLEGLLANNGVDLAFNGHAHIYQRNVAPPGGVTSYVTGGGGAKVSPVTGCRTTDAYSLGWTYSGAHGSKCGGASVPGSDEQVYHFLKVNVSGTSVTVTPTNAKGETFDAVTYDFGADNSAPGAPSGLTAKASGSSVNLAWAGSGSGDVSAQDVYRNGTWLATVLPGVRAYTDKAPVADAGYTVRAHDLSRNQSGDSNTARVGGAADTEKPTVPTDLTATPTGSTSVNLTWSASTDNVGVTAYTISRNGNPLKTVTGTSTTDTGLTPSTTYTYTVSAGDAGGNFSNPSVPASVTTDAGSGGGGATATLTDDATISQTSSAANYGTTSTLAIDADQAVQSFVMKFSVPASCVNPSAATLTLTTGSGSTSGSAHGGTVYRATDTPDWTEGAVTYESAPPKAAGPGVGINGNNAVAISTPYSVDVSSLLGGMSNQTLSLRTETTSTDAAVYNSRNASAGKPTLTLTCG